MTQTTIVHKQRVVPTVPGRVITAFLIVMSVIGAWGLWHDLYEPVQVAGARWTLISALVWFGYGVVLISAVVALQRYGHRPRWGVALGLAWGGLAVAEIAGRANTALAQFAVNMSLGEDGSWTTWVTAPIVEEVFKTLGLVLLIMIPVLLRFGPLDGLFFGAIVGASFQVVENFVFTVLALSNAPTDQGQTISVMVFLRGGIGVFSHVIWSALIGAAIGGLVASTRANRGRRIGYLMAAVGGVLLLHNGTNWASASSHMGLYAAGSVVSLVVLVILTRKLWKSEERRLVLAAAATGAWGVMPREDVEELSGKVEEGRAGRSERKQLRKLSAAETDSLRSAVLEGDKAAPDVEPSS